MLCAVPSCWNIRLEDAAIPSLGLGETSVALVPQNAAAPIGEALRVEVRCRRWCSLRTAIASREGLERPKRLGLLSDIHLG